MNVEKKISFPESLSSWELEEKLRRNYRLRSGSKPKRYRGKHRSQVKGAGIMAFFRSFPRDGRHR